MCDATLEKAEPSFVVVHKARGNVLSILVGRPDASRHESAHSAVFFYRLPFHRIRSLRFARVDRSVARKRHSRDENKYRQNTIIAVCCRFVNERYRGDRSSEHFSGNFTEFFKCSK
ncbi:hypothetical protein CEXT_557201 [Caerostris extrusa]|uniref:Uncharacterized protein n=1 Tax=Caerostris extrusa TaxID=172846 RepID=A0AAV4THV5_CAEEX|nr:hypothetical protein CEXT_557201 [Caerostris extrusa]